VANIEFRVPYSPQYLVLGLIGLVGLGITLALWLVSGIALNTYRCEYGTLNSVFAGKRINTVYRTSVTKDSTVAAKTIVNYKIAFRRAQWAISIHHCISCLFFLSLYFAYDLHINK